MKAIAVFPKSRQVKLVDHAEPRIVSANQVKIKMLQVGVCGTDREIWNFEYGAPPEGSDYLITGHESFGQAIEVGSAVKSIKPGDYVVPTVRRECGDGCISCQNTLQDFCFTGRFTERGIMSAHGFMTEYVVEDEKYLNAIPAELKEVAVLLEPLSITEKALIQVPLIQSRLPWGIGDMSRHNALVLGAGPIGLLAAMVFRHLNMRTFVIARARKPNLKSEIATSIGAEYLSTSEKTVPEIAARIGNIDLILEATGAPKASFDFLQVLGTNGIFIFTGVPAPCETALDTGSLMRNIVLKNQVVLGTVNAPKQAFENGILDLKRFSDRWPGVLRSLVTRQIPLEQFRQTASGREPDEIKTVLAFDP